MPVNASEHCLTDRQLLLSVNGIEQIVLGYLVPCLILFGFTGNLINLTVLMAPGMKTRSNTLLATLAIADMAFLLFMLPHSLAHYKWLAFNNTFRQIYFASKMHLIAFLNWSSAAAIWLVLTICMERLIGIRYPLSVRKHRATHTHLLIAIIVVFTGALTFYNHFSYDCVTKAFCNGTQIHALCLPVDSDSWPNNTPNPHSPLMRIYVRWSQPINAAFVVFLPTLIVVMSNALLIHTLRQRQKFLAQSTHQASMIRRTSLVPSRCNDVNNNNGPKGSTPPLTPTTAAQCSQSAMQMRVEQKVTLTVCAIVTCFTLTQAPSAVVTLATGFVELGGPSYHVHLITATTFMIVVGKSLNFVLFCLSSANFRQRLVTMMKAKFDKNRSHRRLSNADTDVNTTLVTSGFSSSALRNSFYNAKRKCVRALSLNSNLGPNLSAPTTPTEFQLSDSPRTPLSAGPNTPKFFIGRTKTRAASAIEPCSSTVFFPKVETVQEISAE
ncbi:7 transmembrane receptor (rhodopsin family) domain-containing protein [Ditylenchus destructor]|uniref:7 transmembrane receptor (Rhodopsin family) domain-containing protein n=1 Tax=Ditylenchus destructor TaxID=166010 RepID=A0AAD4QYN9_9BILA|nr:7 transmembrane receptor (rhodopsin family) domain-containing protein [Ditylenchus destructor]